MSVNWRQVAFWLTLFWLFYTWPTEGRQYQGPEEIKIWVYPKISVCFFEPCYKRVSVLIERHKDNRWRMLSWNSEEGESGLSIYEMLGEDDAYENVVFVRVSSGSYLFVACVYRWNEGKQSQFCVREETEVR